MANKENIQKWVDALRSGKYEQATGMLGYIPEEGKTPSYCCLGVACVLAGVPSETGLLRIEQGYDVQSNSSELIIKFGEEKQTGILPKEAIEWLGLKPYESDPMVLRHDHEYIDDDNYSKFVELSELNDEHGLNFNEIADRIEETFLTEENENVKEKTNV